MPCGKRPLVKLWDNTRVIREIKPSRYQQNEASVKVHWRRVIKDLEQAYKDDKFWETQAKTVRGLVGPVIFERLAKIFDLTIQDKPYYPEDETSEVVDSEQFYELFNARESVDQKGVTMSVCDFSMTERDEDEEEQEEEEDTWSTSTKTASVSQKTTSRSRTAVAASKSRIHSSKSLIRSKSRGEASFKSFSKLTASKVMSRTFARQKSSMGKLDRESESYSDVIAFTEDDIIVHARSYDVNLKHPKGRQRSDSTHAGSRNPFFEMLYCNESETDMIKWNSNYKVKKFEISASDEYSRKVEILEKEIAYDFYTWWASTGSPEYKSEIKRPQDIEGLFQVWFDEHASRGLVLDPKVLPCVLQSIANFVGVPKAACPKALKRQLAWDIHAETSPAHTLAFNCPLPHKLKHIPPKNDTKESWHPVRIPEELRSMATVWGDISHLTSTKAFHKWLQQRPHMPMPPILDALGAPEDKKQLFVVPSDFVVRDKSMDTLSGQELNIPVSEFSLEIKDVLSRLLND